MKKLHSMMRIKTLIPFLALILLCGCQTPLGVTEWKEKRENYIREHSPSTEVAEAIREGDLIMGMTKEEVVLAWYYPVAKNTTVTKHGTRDQWVYDYEKPGGYDSYAKDFEWGRHYGLRKAGIGPNPDLDGTVYLYFQDGKLDSWQISQ